MVASPRFRSYEWPYGTFLGIAALYAMLNGQQLFACYLRWSGIIN
jgi:hypothetical protein